MTSSPAASIAVSTMSTPVAAKKSWPIAERLKGRRDRMYFGFSWHARESRFEEWRSAAQLREGLDAGLKRRAWSTSICGGSACSHRQPHALSGEIEAVIEALEWAKKTGRARYIGVSSHDQPHLKQLIETYPEQIEVITHSPYTAKTKVVEDETGLWATIKKHNVGGLGLSRLPATLFSKRDSSAR